MGFCLPKSNSLRQVASRAEISLLCNLGPCGGIIFPPLFCHIRHSFVSFLIFAAAAAPERHAPAILRQRRAAPDSQPHQPRAPRFQRAVGFLTRPLPSRARCRPRKEAIPAIGSSRPSIFLLGWLWGTFCARFLKRRTPLL
ncbi:uncharacterized protein TM35_000331540 [Trypanosoma theileri]|uniref:Uncharacterized protein n=1 Tax=Trypanosoma theileri TaxID=67003 RepID=A0A1X0NLY6_9TRYP|nr:uncharacterized protein TM35_000331540 [Trypanosoma theileri]ORC85697.1 hypothetical protein TM35_000331540 [Trypanosoma theileri]